MSHFNPQNENHVRQTERDLVDIATDMIEGRVSTTRGSRKLASICHNLEYLSNSSDFALFVVIDSETDHLPIESTVREHWSQVALARVDAEINEYKRNLRSDANQACIVLIRRFSS